MDNKLCANKIKENIAFPIKDVIVFDMIDSTNTYSKHYAASGSPTPAMILAEYQSAGRGRNGRSFFSPKSTGLYLSLVYTPDATPNDALISTIAASVASAIAIEEITGKNIQIKWVNDIYLDSKKAGGILCESVFVDGKMSIIVGIGINISTEGFPEFDNNSPTSVGELDRNVLAGRIYDKFMYYISPENHDECLVKYRERFYLLNKVINVHRADGKIDVGIARDVDDRGGLIVEINDKTEIIRTGEVTVRIK